MERRLKFWIRPILPLLLVGTMALVGCEGDTGSPGATGPAGPEGPAGTDATVSIETLAELGLVFADDVTAINPTLDLTRTVSYDAATGALTIHFFLTDEDGNGIDVTTIPYEIRLLSSELVPTDTSVTDNPGPAWNQLFQERGTPAIAGSELPGTLTLVDAATGEYNYVPANTIPSTNTNVIRVTMRARFRFRDNNNQNIVVANAVNASYDFLLSDAGTKLDAATTDLAQFVTTAACESCHGARIGDVGHGGGYTQVTTCNNCHNLNFLAAEGDSLEADFAFLIHRIHNAGAFTDVFDHSGNLADFSELTYPQHIFTCGKCHDGAQADQAIANVTRSNCGSCHEVDFTLAASDPGAHSGGAQADDSNCTLCHSENGIGRGPIQAHDILQDRAPAAADTPEFDVSIDITDPANGTHYVPGETPIVTVTLTNHATGNPVPNTVYTTPQDGEGVANVTEGLSTANLFVYGPRNEAVPVLTTASTTDIANIAETAGDPRNNGNGICEPDEFAVGACAPPTQGHSLFVPSTDPRVTTSTSGYSYLLVGIGFLEPGTYMVRFEGADYGGVTSTDYVTSSSAVITFQVGTDIEEPKVSGNACLNCHGDTIMHLTGSHAHHAPFDTDHCLGCHDKSGNYGDYIGNRVHAVHRASVTGDAHATQGIPRDWFDVTFPRPANNCTTCHTNADADTPVWRQPEMLPCGGCHGASPDVDPNNPVFYTGLTADQAAEKEEQIRMEVAAAQHMQQNGGTTDPRVTPTLQCLVCHGEGKNDDLFVTHDLIRFRPLPVDPNE